MNMDSISPTSSGISRSGGAAPRPEPRALRPARAAVPPPDLSVAADVLRASGAPVGSGETAGQGTEHLRTRLEAETARLEGLNQALKFRVHDGTGQLMVQVVDRNTGEVLRETPPEEFLDLAVRLREMVGFFLDETR